jgi:hypothetical protein
MDKRQPSCQYIIAQEEMIVTLAMKVNELIAEGFKPIGGVAIGKNYFSNKTIYCQAMIREVNV